MISIFQNGLAILGLIIAVIFGIYAQDLSYFLIDLQPNIDINIFMSLITLTSIGLFIAIPTLTFFSKHVEKVMFAIYFVVSFAIGIPILLWAIFVWLMGLG